VTTVGVFPAWWDANPETFDPQAWLDERIADAAARIPTGLTAERAAQWWRTWRQQATFDDPMLFALVYLREHLTGPDGRITVADPHLDWCRQAWWFTEPVPDIGKDRRALVAPRDTGKSTWWFLLIVMWLAAHGHEKFVAAFAHSATQAQNHLRTFRHELDTNDLLKADYPDLCTRSPVRDLERRTEATTVDNQSMLVARSGFAFVARGIDSSNLGLKIGKRRPGMILLDDVEPDEAEYSADLAEKRLRTVIDAVLAMSLRARVILVGTVTMDGSIVHQLVRSVTTPEDEPAPWIREENFACHYYRPIVVRDDGSERSTWPAKWPYEYLVSIRHTRSYAKNFANQPINPDSGWWRPEDIQYWAPDGYDRTVLVVDGAVTVKKTSDWTGLAVASLRVRDRAFIVREAVQVKMAGEDLRTKALDLIEAHGIDYILVEANQGGDLWHLVFRSMPVKVSTFTNREPKQYRIKRLLAAYQYAGVARCRTHKQINVSCLDCMRRGAVFHEKPLPQLERQALAYPNVVHEDILDATAGVVEHLLWILLQKLGVAGQQASVQQLRRAG
jgi:hypothetical protein